MSVLCQMLCTAIVCYLSLNMGIVFAWPSSTTKLFESNATSLHRPMRPAEINLFGSLSSIGAMIGTPAAGYYMDVIGRKKCVIATSLTYVIGWAMIAFSNQVEVVLSAVFILGFGAAAMLIVRVYVSEICQASIRGAMTTFSLVFFIAGMLISYVMGDVLEYKQMVHMNLGLAVVGPALYWILKDSPTFLMKKGMDEQAAISFAFYRQLHPDSKEVLDEVDKLRRAFHPDLPDGLAPEGVKLKPGDKVHEREEVKLKPDDKVHERHDDKISLWMFLKRSKPTHKAITLTITLVTMGTFQGIIALQVYAKPLFVEAVPSMSATLCSVLQAIVTLITGVFSGFLTDCAGRRPLLIYASLGTCACSIVLGTQLQMHWAPHWLTAVVMYLFSMAYTFGAGSVPYVLVTDVFLPEVKSLMSMLVIEWSWLCCFIVLFLYKPLVLLIGLAPVFFVFAAVCFITALYAMFYMPETKGLPVDRIEEVFGSKKRSSVSLVRS